MIGPVNLSQGVSRHGDVYKAIDVESIRSSLQSEKPGGVEAPEKICVLVVGDWLVDEHWVMGRHRAFSSSRTGREHYRALHISQCSVRSLCGAGQVATILHEATMPEGAGNKVHPFQVSGVGIWNPGDSVILQEMLRPAFNIGRTPHRLEHDVPVAPKEGLNQGKLWCLTPLELANKLSKEVGITRVIREYRHFGDHVELESRKDWEIPLTDSDFAAIRRAIPKSLQGLSASNVTHIFVKDLLKGAVSTELIKWLSDHFPQAAWYVSSKGWQPAWFDLVQKADVRLVLVPQLAAQRAIQKGDISSSSWLTTGGVPSQDALKVMDGIAETFSRARIVVLPEGMRVLARDGTEAYVQPSPGVADTFPFTPMASVFFPALAAHMITYPKTDFFHTLRSALSFTAVWETAESERIKIDTWTPRPEQVLTLGHYGTSADIARWHGYGWETLKREWKDAFSELGVVDITGGRRPRREFQLWRAMTDVEGFVTCVPSKRRCLSTLLREGRSLRQTVPAERADKAFFIVDVPGSGKTFMVDCLASTLRMPCLKFNIASLPERDDLIECFERIRAAQGDPSHFPMIVFFDEMNCTIQNQYVYDAFLEPLEAGKYVHNGKTFPLAPCLWIFAGTQAPSESDAGNPATKASDFESRLSYPVMYPSGRKQPTETGPARDTGLEELRRMEQVYLGVATIQATFPDVTKISEKVLRAFSLLPPDKVGPRGIRRFVRSFTYVQYGRVMKSNLPEDWYKQFDVSVGAFHDWNRGDDQESVLIIISGQPPIAALHSR